MNNLIIIHCDLHELSDIIMSGTKVQVDDFEIYYEKHGTGDHHLLLIPGVLGKIFHFSIH